jgi:hypothetical protein
MKVPKPRLRQVFEHTTHFKVFKPGVQKPIVIAKAGLTPGLHGRLRAFAQGGEVRNYADGGNVTESDFLQSLADFPQEERTAAIKQYLESRNAQPAEEPTTFNATEAVAAEPQQLKFVPTPTVEPEAKPTTMKVSEEVAKEDRARRIALAEGIKSSTDAVPVAVENAPATPVAVAAAPSPVVVVPATPAPAPVAAAPAVEPERPAVPIGPIAQTFAPAPVVAAPSAAPATAPAPVVAPAPVAAPTPALPAPAAPADFVMPPKVGEMAPADALSATLKANPKKTKEEVAAALADLAVPKPAAKPDFDAMLAAVESKEGTTAVEQFDAATQARRKAAIEKAKADYDAQTQIADINRKAMAQQILAAGKNEEVKAKLEQRKASLEDYVSKGFTPKSFFGKQGTGTFWEQLGSIVALAVGGYTSGYAGTPNYVYTAFNNAMDRNLELQKQNRDSVLKQYERVLGDYDSAKKLTEADMKNMAALQIKQIELTSAQRNIGPVTQDLIAKLDASAAEDREEVRKKVYDADRAKIDAETEKAIRDATVINKQRGPATAGLGFARFDLARQRLKWAQENRDQSSTWSIPDPQDPARDIVIKSVSPTAATSARKEAGQRVAALQRVEKLDNFLGQIAASGNSIDPQTVREVQTQLAEVVENYPALSKGTTQLVTQAQAQLLKGALESTPIPYVRYTDFLGLTRTAIEKLREEGVNNLSLSVRGNAKPGDAGAAEFASKFGTRGYRGKTGVTEKPAAKPAGGSPPPSPSGQQAATVYTITNNKTNASVTTTDAAQAKSFRGQPEWTVVP